MKCGQIVLAHGILNGNNSIEGCNPLDFSEPVFPYVRAFAFVRQADKASNANNKDNPLQSLSIDSIPTV
jgi:hypothetical protein